MRDDDFYFSVSLDKFSSNDGALGMADFRVGNDPWATFKYEDINLNFGDSLRRSDEREKRKHIYNHHDS